MPDVQVEAGELTTVTINRPERRNALTVALTREIADTVEKSASSCRAIILTGAGSAFSGGGDFEELERLSASDPEEAAGHLYDGFQKMIRAIREAEVPVIAAVNGPAMGAGMDLALACDLRIASTAAKFGQVWARLGIIPGTGGAFWTALLAGPARAAEMLLTAEVIDADAAERWGLVNEVTSPDDLLPRARAVGEAIAANPRGAVAANKKALNEVIRPLYEKALQYAREVQPGLFAGPEFKQALNARAKKTP
ncbi:MAG: enoyl-CoA hydratase/isomerase family protein [Actinomycetota bacterium]